MDFYQDTANLRDERTKLNWKHGKNSLRVYWCRFCQVKKKQQGHTIDRQGDKTL